MPTPLSFGLNLRNLRTGAFQLLETRHARGMRLASHVHEHACVNFVLDGCYRENVGGLHAAFEPQVAAFKPAAAEHANHFEHAPARCLLVELLDDEAAEGELALDDVRWTRAPEAVRVALALWHEIARPDGCSAFVVDQLSWELYADLLGAGHCPRAPASAVRAACDALHDDPSAPWTLSALAHHVGRHPSHLARAFRTSRGATVGAYLRALRRNELARRLALDDRPIAELSGALGFADQSHGTRAFRTGFGTTPAAWRRAFRPR